MRPATVALAGALLLLSGCMGSTFTVRASSPLVLTSYAYDGNDGREREGALEATLYEKRNEGRVEATYRDAIHEYRIRWINFTGMMPYQSGGVARNVELFGDSGNGSTALPRLFVYAAAWGTVEYYVDDVRQPDPHSLFQTMDAIFFVTQGVYRDNETRRISGAEGNRTYDPARPSESRLNMIGAMAVIGIFTKRGDLYRLVEFSEVEIVSS